MDGIYHDLSRKTDPGKLLGYLNFSDGRPDPRFQKGLDDTFGLLLDRGDPATWKTAPGGLLAASDDLAAGMLQIRRDYVWLHGQAIEKDTKIHQIRRIALDTATVDVELLDGSKVVAREPGTIHYMVLMTPAENSWKVRDIEAVPSF